MTFVCGNFIFEMVLTTRLPQVTTMSEKRGQNEQNIIYKHIMFVVSGN